MLANLEALKRDCLKYLMNMYLSLCVYLCMYILTPHGKGRGKGMAWQLRTQQFFPTFYNKN